MMLLIHKRNIKLAFFFCAICLAAIFHSLSALSANLKHTEPPGTMTPSKKNLQFRLGNTNSNAAIKWLCYYGSNRSVLGLPDYKLKILEADALGPITGEEKNGGVCIAYMSIGDVSRSRWFWPLIKDKSWLLDADPDWHSFMVDPRSQEWSDFIANTIAPKLLAAGYDGFMLDNVDIGEYLENTDPDAYKGAQDAIKNIIKRLRSAFPEAVIIANGGLDTAAEVSECLDAVVSESNFSKWVSASDGSISYENATGEDKGWRLPRLLRIRGLGLPILSLEYVDTENKVMMDKVKEEAKKAGYHPFIGEHDLMRFPGDNAPNNN